MEVRYVLTDPTGNGTILVETPVQEERQPRVAAALMALEPTAEQAGFLSFPGDCDIALRMAGGEFCGNAAMSAAAIRAEQAGVSEGTFRVRVSGAPEPVKVVLGRETDRLWRGTVDMPRPLSVETKNLENMEVPVVTFQGISHVILEKPLPEREAETLVKRWCGLLRADALGLMLLDRENAALRPLVYVPGADTLFWESACGSGSSAVGAWLARKRGGEVTISLRQPGGVLEVTALPFGPVTLRGRVRLVRRVRTALEMK